MSWSIGFDNNWQRDIGYGVPAYCDHPQCWAEINRGLGYVCGAEPYGGERGCGLYFCEHHAYGDKQLCPRCRYSRTPYKAKADHHDWLRHKETDESWAEWRAERGKVAAPPLGPS